MKRKRAVIIVDLVEESAEKENESLSADLIRWFREDAIAIPWVKEVRAVTIEET